MHVPDAEEFAVAAMLAAPHHSGPVPGRLRPRHPAGYLAAEEFLVLDGLLELESMWHDHGTLVHAPANLLRTDLRAPEGCTVLAWFRGPVEFLTADQLDSVGEPIRSVVLSKRRPGIVLKTAEAAWTLGERRLAGVPAARGSPCSASGSVRLPAGRAR